MLPPRLKIVASAGAGKTWRLAVRYLGLLSLLKNKDELGSIVAITFTNKAAAEMRERILKFLKLIALETPEGRMLIEEAGIPLDPDSAKKWVGWIIERYSDFNVRTIDSLLFSILKALSFELNLREELDVVFDKRAVFDVAFDEFLALWEKEREILAEALRNFLEVDERSGFYPEAGLRKRLYDLMEELEGRRVGEKDYVGDLKGAWNDFVDGWKRFVKEIDPFRECLNRNKTRWLVDDLDEEVLEKVLRGLSNYSDFSDLWKKKEWGRLPEELKERLSGLYGELRERALRYAFLWCAAKVSGYSSVLHRLQELFEGVCRKQGIVVGGESWLSDVKRKLEEQDIIPLVYAFFGVKFRHFLFDEFQDTSRRQWETLWPIIENALSEGGTLFVVGDPKQAIYRWRGGDWRLFGEVEAEVERLEFNRRSASELVEFFNRTFKPLEDQVEVRLHWRNMYRLGGRVFDEVAAEISRAFEKVEQRPVDSVASPGSIEILKFTGGGDELDEMVREALVGEVSRLWENGLRDVAVLVRSNDEGRRVTEWLLAEDMPVVTENSLRLGVSDAVKGLVGLLEYINSGSEQGLYAFCASGIYRNEKGETFDEGSLFKAWRDEAGRAKLKNEVDEFIRGLSHIANKRSPYELVASVVERLEVKKRFAKELPFIERFLEVLHLFEVEEGPHIGMFLDFLKEGGLEKRVGIAENVEAVKVMTIHKAKGLEFDVVFVPFTGWGLKDRSPVKFHEEKGCLVHLTKYAKYVPELDDMLSEHVARHFQDAINLFYVALTRAKRKLYLFLTEHLNAKGMRSPVLWFERLVRGAVGDGGIKDKNQLQMEV